MEDRRKVLYSVVRHLVEQGEKVSLVTDTLYIDNQLYDINTEKYTDKRGHKPYVRPFNPSTKTVDE